MNLIFTTTARTLCTILVLCVGGCRAEPTATDVDPPADTCAGASDQADCTDSDPADDDTDDPIAAPEDTDARCARYEAPPSGPLSQGAGAFDFTALEHSTGVRSCLVVHDLDHDGHLDILWGAPKTDGATEFGRPTEFSMVAMWGQEGTGFDISRWDVPHLPYTCALHPLTPDAAPTLVYTDARGVVGAEGLEERAFRPQVLFEDPGEHFSTDMLSLAMVDLDQDGHDDMIVTTAGTVYPCSPIDQDTDAGGTINIFEDNLEPGEVLCLIQDDAGGWSMTDEAPCPAALQDFETVYPFQISLQDLGHDGRPEILFTGDYAPNLFLSSVPGGWRDDTSATGLDVYNHAMGVAWFDDDGDGLRDLYITDFGPDQLRTSRDCRAFFLDSLATGVNQATRFTISWSALALDLDHNGDLDLHITQNLELGRPYQGNLCNLFDDGLPRPDDFVLLQEQPGQFRRVDVPGPPRRTEGPVWDQWMPVYAAAGDLDEDGDLDVVVADRYRGVVVYHNATPPAGAWIGVTPIGDQGWPVRPARVVVSHDGGRRVQEKWPTTGTNAFDPGAFHFGLGPSPGSVHVEIRWPDGQWSRHVGLAPGQTHRVPKPPAAGSTP